MLIVAERDDNGNLIESNKAEIAYDTSGMGILIQKIDPEYKKICKQNGCNPNVNSIFLSGPFPVCK